MSDPSLPASSNTPLPPGGRPSRARIVGATVAIGLALISAYAAWVLPVFSTTLQHYFGIGTEAYGFLLSVGGLGAMVAALVSGVLVDCYGSRRVLRLSLVGLALAMAVLACCGSLWPLMAVGLGLVTLFQTSFLVALAAYLVQQFPDSKRRVLSLSSALQNIGGVAFPSLAEGLLWVARAGPAIGFALVLHVPFAVVAVLLLAGALYYRRSRSAEVAAEVTPVPAATTPWSWRRLLLPWKTLFLLLLTSIHGLGDVTLSTWLPTYLQSDVFPESSTAWLKPGLVLSGFGAAYFLSRSALFFMPERFGRRALLVVPGLLGGGLLLAGILSRNYYLTAGSYMLTAFIWSVEFPALMGRIADEDRQHFGMANALVVCGGGLAAFLGVNLVGYVAGHLPSQEMWKAMLIPAACFPCVGLGAILWLYVYRKRG